MMRVFPVQWNEDGSGTTLGRITAMNGSGSATGVNGEGNWLQVLDISSVNMKVYDLDSATPRTATNGSGAGEALTVNSSLILDTPVTSNANWTEDTVGYNFIYTVAGTYFPTGGHRYRVVYTITTTGGEQFTAAYEGEAARVDIQLPPPSVVSLPEIIGLLGLSSPTDQELLFANEALRSALGAVVRHLKYHPVIGVRTEYYPRLDFSLQNRATSWEVDANEAYIRRLSESAVDELQLQGLPIREADQSGGNTIDLRIDYDARAETKSGSFAVSTQKTEGTDFWPNYDLVDSNTRKVCNDGILRSEGRWPSVPGSVKVVYVSGYTADELSGQDSVIDASPIRESVVDETVRRVHKIFARKKKAMLGFGTGGFTSENLGDYSYSADGTLLKQLIAGASGSAASDLSSDTIMRLEQFVNYGVMLAS